MAQILALLSCLWFAFASAWGLFQIPGGGHSGAGSVGHALASWPIAKWKILYPVIDWYPQGPPSKAAYYCHHPFGSFWWAALWGFLLGRHDYVVRLPTVILSVAIPPLLYGIGKQHWGPVGGAIAACAYVVVPIAIGFANFDNLETLGIFGSLLFFWGHSRYQVTRRRRHLVASLLGCAACCSADWYGYFTVAPLLGWSLLRAFVLPERWTPRIDPRSYARWWALSATVAVGTFALWIALFYKADKISDWLTSGDVRGGDATPLKAVLESRRSWIEFSFTPLAIALGKAAVPLGLARLALRRCDEEVYALSALCGAVFEYLAFKRGADVHIFWPHQFAEYYALALPQIAATMGGLARLTSRVWTSRPRAAAIGAWTMLASGLVPSLAMTPDACRSLLVWRRTGGRYDDKGALIRSDLDLLFVVRHAIVPNKPPNSLIDTSTALGWGWEHIWGYDGPSESAADPAANAPRSTNHPFWVGRASALSAADQLRIAREAHVRAFGDIWVVDQRDSPGPIDAFQLEEREPNALEWLAFGGWEPVRRIGPPDPLRTWEWRVHLDQPAAMPPDATGTTLDDLRILHNAAVYAGATRRAEELGNKIRSLLDRHVAAAFDQGVELAGVRVTQGVQPRLEIWFVASGPLGETSFRVRSTIDAPARLSLIPVDPVDREMAFSFRIPTKLWRRGFMYELDVVLNRRIGVERYWGAWAGGPRRLDGSPETTLAVLP